MKNLLREIGDRHVRLTYDNGDLEIMTLSFAHENAGEWLGRLVFFLALELNIAICSGGTTTLRRAAEKGTGARQRASGSNTNSTCAARKTGMC